MRSLLAVTALFLAPAGLLFAPAGLAGQTTSSSAIVLEAAGPQNCPVGIVAQHTL